MSMLAVGARLSPTGYSATPHPENTSLMSKSELPIIAQWRGVLKDVGIPFQWTLSPARRLRPGAIAVALAASSRQPIMLALSRRFWSSPAYRLIYLPSSLRLLLS
jgi:hypothetical protein